MSGGERLENVSPDVHGVVADREPTSRELDDHHADAVDSREVFDMVRTIVDPEHPLTLEQLRVVEERLITVENDTAVDERGGGVACRRVHILFTPTIPHCSMATLIGLSIRVKLQRSLPPYTKIHVAIAPGTHVSEHAVNRQLADKERVAAATENSRLLQVVHQCLAPSIIV